MEGIKNLIRYQFDNEVGNIYKYIKHKLSIKCYYTEENDLFRIVYNEYTLNYILDNIKLAIFLHAIDLKYINKYQQDLFEPE